MNSSRYLNVDCILRSSEPLSEFLNFLGDDVFVLWNNDEDGHSYIGFETNLVNTPSPEMDIVEFFRLFERPYCRGVIERCHERVLDIGFEGGVEGDPVDVAISSNTVKNIYRLGFSINIRVYPFPGLPDESNGKKTKDTEK